MKTGCIFCFLILLFFLMACKKPVSEQENVLPKSANMLSDISSSAGTANRSVKEAPGFTSGQVLVKFKKGATPQIIEEIQQELGLETVKVVSQPSLYLMKVNKDVSLDAVVERLGHFEAVSYAEPNYTRTSQ